MSTNHTNINIEGFGSLVTGDYGNVQIEGFGIIKGDISFERLSVEGTGKGTGKLEGERMSVSGILHHTGDIKVKLLEIEGVVTTKDSKIYADHLSVEGVLKNSGEVNADRIIIEGCANLNDLFGDEIRLNYGGIGVGFLVGLGSRTFFSKMNTANNIECSKLIAHNITCKSISGTELYLYENCHVNTVICNGVLHYDRSCKIDHVEGDCVQIRD